MKSAAGLLLDHLLFLMQRPVPCSPRSKAYVMLMDVGVPDNYKGHEYVLQAIILQHASPERGLKNDIYHEITLRYRLNSEEQVDQAIRQVRSKSPPVSGHGSPGSRQRWHRCACWYSQFPAAPTPKTSLNAFSAGHKAFSRFPHRSRMLQIPRSPMFSGRTTPVCSSCMTKWWSWASTIPSFPCGSRQEVH